MRSIPAKGNTRCRTCYETPSYLYSLQEQVDAEQKKSLADLLFDIAKIETKPENVDNLPKHLCGNCSRKLKCAYTFVQQAQRVNKSLLAHLPITVDVGKHLDCLLEAPIDLPTINVNDCLQIKLENNDYAEGSSYDVLSNANNTIAALAVEPIEKALVEQESLKQENITFDIDREAQQSETTDAYLKSDPITLHDAEEGNAEFTTYHNNSDSIDEAEPQPIKRKRGRPRLSGTAHIDRRTNEKGRYTCDVCHKTFAWLKDLMRHVKSHYARAEFQCEHCERCFIRKDKLKDHMKTHRDPNYSIDDVANTKYYTLRAPRHPEWSFAERLYTELPLRLVECKLCNEKFNSIGILRKHLIQHTQPETITLQMESEVIKELFPQAEELADIKNSVCSDVSQQRLNRYCAVVNAYGYELSLSDSDADNESASATHYKCELCHEEFRRKHQVYLHIKQQHAATELPYKCKICELGFVCQSIFRLHTRTQCNSEEKKYQCSKCPGKFIWPENLKGHQCSSRANSSSLKVKQLPHKRKLLKHNILDKATNKIEPSDVDEENLFECDVCLLRFPKANSLTKHMRVVHAHHTRCLRCCLCGNEFERLSLLREHLRQHADGHTGIDTAKSAFYKMNHAEDCVEDHSRLAEKIAKDFAEQNIACYYSAVNESGTEMDISDSETDDDAAPREYPCAVCSETFQKRKHILAHQQAQHSKTATDLPHNCANCSKQFVCSELLERHRKRDCLNVDRKLECNKCMARFVWQENLEVHERLKHSDDETQLSRQLMKKLRCDQCDKKFIWPKDLTRHRRVHMPDDEKYECPTCDRKFNRKDNMVSHMKVHGVDPVTNSKKETSRYKTNRMQEIADDLCKRHGCKRIYCMVCLSSHSKISDLRTHLRTHQYAVNFTQRLETIEKISQQLYPDRRPMTENHLRELIQADVAAQRFDAFYSITNEFGYELSLDSSETESDSETDETANASNAARRNYICEMCGAACARKYQMYKHQKQMHAWDEAPYVCMHCHARFVSAEFLQLHYEQQCKNTHKRYLCRKCPQRFMWKDNLNAHMRTKHLTDADELKRKSDTANSLECLQCNRSFRMQKDLTRHLLVHRSDALIFKCHWCPRKFYREENLHMHLRRHEINPEQLTAAECIIKATTARNGPKQVQCKVCGIQFPNIKSLRLHLLQESGTHHNYNSPLNYSITNELGFELQLDDSDTDDEGMPMIDKLYTCKLCNLTCKRQYEMTLHQRSIHKHEQVPLKCERCVFRTVSPEILTRHLATQCHNENKQFQCTQCSFRFMWMDNLLAHVMRLHPPQQQKPPEKDHNENADMPSNGADSFGDKSAPKAQVFKCDKCNRKYNRKDRLAAHIKKAHGEAKPDAIDSKTIQSAPENDEAASVKSIAAPPEKKFLCAFCGRAVTSSSNLIIHMRRHTGEKPFKCDFCDMAFPRSSDLQCHRRTHTGEKPHKCTVCDKAFSRSYKLQTHMRVHSGEKPYKCSYCDKSFAQSNDLTLHIRRHTGERPYVCGICGERFIQGTALKNHRAMRGHYEDIPPRRSTLFEQC